MKTWLGCGLVLPLAALLVLSPARRAPAQVRHSHVARATVHSRPSLPPADVLRRLNLKIAWYRYIPVDGRRDGLTTVQIDGRDMFVQTRSGLIVRLDAETGVVRWRSRVGRPYQVAWPLGLNFNGVYVVNSTYLYGLDRSTGSRLWRFTLPAGLSAPPLADDDMIYLAAVDGRLYAYHLPRLEAPATGARPAPTPGTRGSDSSGAGAAAEPTTELRYAWSEVPGLALDLPLAQTSEAILALSANGSALAFAKSRREAASAPELYRFTLGARIPAAPGQYGDILYIGARDANLYAMDLATGKLVWRSTTGSPLTRQPVPLARDIFAVSEHGGLTRVDRDTGEPLWRLPRGRRVLSSNPEAVRFLAANPKFVYATDASDRLLILGRKRGVRLSMYDTHAFNVPIVNGVTDRLYLGANDGLMVCLHDRDYARPIRHRREEEELANPVKKKLATPVTDAGGKPAPLREVVQGLRTKYRLKIVVSERAFEAAGVKGIQTKLVTTPRVDARPLSQFLQLMLNQVNATFDVIDDTVLIVPGKPKKK
jgi:outer membrane protein assembly factor BamB